MHNVQDWDAPAGAISWDRLVNFLKTVRKTGEIPQDHRSHDHLNENNEIDIDENVKAKWIKEFEGLKKDNQGEQVLWVLVDGFLLYWHKVWANILNFSSEFQTIRFFQEVVDQLDVRVMLRVPHDVLLSRRHHRSGYYTAGRGFIACRLLRRSLVITLSS